MTRTVSIRAASLMGLAAALLLGGCADSPPEGAADTGALPPATLNGAEVVTGPDKPSPEALDRAEAVSDAAAATTGAHADVGPRAREIGERERELALVRRKLVSQRHTLRQRRVAVDPGLDAEVLAATTARPSATEPAARLAEINAAILDARNLSDRLAALLS
ncbi:hypothetical protein FDP22_09730 [Paroceanicella profunda]|uniref:Uncharacterized protein n=1 Tax=Paroceanicella profunda TaxID=2579971 RepID=A0A5B8FH58_9RHOB|nr:hypothetical protein [Paroceanicella profunda]QDL92031.1 hypothetical protein FDP22_09730 [Paroceanicella profunda]